MNKTYRIKAKVEGISEPFVDYYQAENEEDARAQWTEEAIAEKFPVAKTTLTIEEKPEYAWLFNK